MLGPHSPCATYSYAAILWILHAPCIRALLYGQAHMRRLVVGAVGAHGANDSAGPVIQNTVTDISRNSRWYVYQLVEKPGWVWIPPSLVVLLSLQIVSFSGESGLPVAFEAPDSLFYRRCDGRRPYSSARTFNDLTACQCTRYLSGTRAKVPN
jgi:hypothetical protein